MRLGRQQAAGYVEDTEAEPIASAELALGAAALIQPAPDPQPAALAV
jgi:hypothetical protein